MFYFWDARSTESHFFPIDENNFIKKQCEYAVFKSVRDKDNNLKSTRCARQEQ